MVFSPQILIAGAGPSGLVVALSLLQNGIPVRIIDKELVHRPGQRGSGIMPRTIEAYNILGVREDILAQGCLNFPVKMYAADGVTPVKTFRMNPVEEPSPAIPWPNPYMLGQSRAEEILRNHLAKYHCEVEVATELKSFEQNEDHVTAHIIKHKDGKEEEETVTVKWLIGADGAKGVTRKQLGLTFSGETHEEAQLLVGDVYMTGLEAGFWHMWRNADNLGIVVRGTEQKGLFNFTIPVQNLDPQKLINDHEELKKVIRSATNRPHLQFGEVLWLSSFKPNVRMANKFSEGRVFVVGDAAHVHSPTGGQGMNSSVQDAFNVGWKLALVEKGLAAPTLLNTYDEERIPVITEMLRKTTSLLNKLVTSKATDESPWKRGKILYQLGVNYRWSSIVLDEQSTGAISSEERYNSYGAGSEGDTIHAGDRAPDVPGLVDLVHAGSDDKALTTSFFALFGSSYHTVLVFVNSVEKASPLLEAVRHFPAAAIRTVIVLPKGAVLSGKADVDHALEDREGYAYSGYAIPEENTTAVIVRPDGVIGAIVRGAQGVEKYFKGIFVI